MGLPTSKRRCTATTAKGVQCRRRALRGQLCSVHAGKARRAEDVLAKLGLGEVELTTLADVRDLVARVSLAALRGELSTEHVGAFTRLMPTLRQCIAACGDDTQPLGAEHEHKSPQQILGELVETLTPQAIADVSRGRLRLVEDEDEEVA